ncbi:MAG TPA: hypothetical protein VHT93_17815 [Pseudolabrys sp.]|jgi:hypothetical protein|nr:hypothetical protein [Pseudolabrys sp.]
MPAQSTFDIKAFDLKDVTRRWHALAERRLASYEDLYRSGRWRHYYASQEEFAARMLDVIKAAKAYQKLVVDSPSLVPRQDPSREDPSRQELPRQELPRQELPHHEPLRSASPRAERLRPAA